MEPSSLIISVCPRSPSESPVPTLITIVLTLMLQEPAHRLLLSNVFTVHPPGQISSGLSETRLRARTRVDHKNHERFDFIKISITVPTIPIINTDSEAHLASESLLPAAIIITSPTEKWIRNPPMPLARSVGRLRGPPRTEGTWPSTARPAPPGVPAPLAVV